MPTTHPVALKSITKVPNQKVARWPKRFRSSSSSSSYIRMVELCTELFMLYLVSMLFADLLSLHLITFSFSLVLMVAVNGGIMHEPKVSALHT